MKEIIVLLLIGAAAWLLLVRTRQLTAWRKAQPTRESCLSLREYLIEKTPLHTVGARKIRGGKWVVYTGAYAGGGFLFRVVQVALPAEYPRAVIAAEINTAIAAALDEGVTI
jgi:hypothetical protein